jgi:hypothetical protein
LLIVYLNLRMIQNTTKVLKFLKFFLQNTLGIIFLVSPPASSHKRSELFFFLILHALVQQEIRSFGSSSVFLGVSYIFYLYLFIFLVILFYFSSISLIFILFQTLALEGYCPQHNRSPNVILL